MAFTLQKIPLCRRKCIPRIATKTNYEVILGYDSYSECHNLNSTMIKRRYHLGRPTVLCGAERKVVDNSWREVKEKFLKMDIDEKRKHYLFKGKYYELGRLRPWPVYFDHLKLPESDKEKKYPVNFAINGRVSVGKANIIALELDAIITPAAPDMMGGGGEVDALVHQAAGKELKLECSTFHGCDFGGAKITGGYKLPAKYVIHTVGPRGENPSQLHDCYISCLNLMKIHRLKTIVFPCISTGSTGYPAEKAAHVVLEAIRKFLQKNPEKPNRICLAIHLPEDLRVYQDLMQVYFPLK